MSTQIDSQINLLTSEALNAFPALKPYGVTTAAKINGVVTIVSEYDLDPDYLPVREFEEYLENSTGITFPKKRNLCSHLNYSDTLDGAICNECGLEVAE